MPALDPRLIGEWIAWGIRLAAAGALAVGALSAAAPRRSIALYQWIMAQCNWRVSPIDERRELITTRLPGILLVALSLVLAFVLMGGKMAAAEQTATRTDTATFAGGCFWCMQPPFDETAGVISTTVGYTGGTEPDPAYEQVASGATGHAEAIQVVYDPATVTYEQLLEVFWRNINPTTPNQQFADKGTQYRTAIFTHSAQQQQSAEASKARLAASGRFDKPIVTAIVPASAFYPAEERHQHYYKKNAVHYNLYKIGSGRDGYLKKTWGAH